MTDKQWIGRLIFTLIQIVPRIAETVHILHYSDAIMDKMASQITSLTIVYTTV